MAQLQGTHNGYEFEAFWNVQDRMLYWGAVVCRGGHVASRPQGQLRESALDEKDADAIRALVIQSIDEGLDLTPPSDV